MQSAPVVELVRHSALAAARVRRKLSVEEAAERAGIAADEVTWLEEGRVYRFPSVDAALNACLLLATALEIDSAEARQMAGLPPRHRIDVRNPLVRLVAVAALAALVSAIGVAAAFSKFDLGGSKKVVAAAPPVKRQPKLPPPWRFQIDVLNGSGDINYTRRVADHISSLGYTVKRVTKATRFDYLQTAVYYEPPARRGCVRLARQLGVISRPLPGGTNPRRCVVIVGPERGPG